MEILSKAATMAERRAERALSVLGLTYPQYCLLVEVKRSGEGTPLGVIADSMRCSRGNLTGVADRLERDGWVERDRSKDDRRVVNIRFVNTPANEARWDQAQAIVKGVSPKLPPEVEAYLTGIA